MEDTICYLIGGAPRTGKTTLARQLAAEHHTQPLSTDSLLVMFRKIVRREDHPDLFFIQGMTVEEFYEKYDTPQKALEASLKAGRDAEGSLTALLEYIIPSWKVVVMEGDVITPEYAQRMREKFPKTAFHVTFLYDEDGEYIQERVFREGLWSRTVPYTDAVKPKEIAYAKAYNQWFYDEARRYGMEIKKIA